MSNSQPATGRTGSRTTAAKAAATADPGVATLTFLAQIDAAVLPPAGLVDAVIATERLLAHVNALQCGLLAELGKPGRAGDVSGLVTALVDKGGKARGMDGEIDELLLAELTKEKAVGMAATQIAAVLDWAPTTAKIRIGEATDLTTSLPSTYAALSQGRIDVGRTRMIIDRTTVLDAVSKATVENQILPLVKGRSRARLETLVDRAVIIADPAAAENRATKAKQDRSVIHRPDKDGMGIINALLPADAAVQVFTLVNLIADANTGLDERTVDQRRADALSDIADQLLTYGYVDLTGITPDHWAQHDNDATSHRREAGDYSKDRPGSEDPRQSHAAASSAEMPTEPSDAGAIATAHSESVVTGPGTVDLRAEAAASGQPCAGAATFSDTRPVGTSNLSRALTRHGRRPHLVVTGALSTLAGLDDLPGHLDGHGTITAEMLRAIAKSWGSLSTAAVDATTGTGTAVGAHIYRPHQRLADEVITLAGTCRMAGCRQPAWRCDIDHLTSYDHRRPDAGGQTQLANLTVLCRWHHLLKHHAGWHPQPLPDNTIRWTSPTGHHSIHTPREFILPGEWEIPSRRQDLIPTSTVANTAVGNGNGNEVQDQDLIAPDRLTTDPRPDIACRNDAVPGNRVLTDKLATDTHLDIACQGHSELEDHVLPDQISAGPHSAIAREIHSEHARGNNSEFDDQVFPNQISAGRRPDIAGQDHSELEGLDTIPIPGTPAAWTYRILRREQQEHTLRRLRRARVAMADPTAALKRHYIQGFDVDLPDENIDPATQAQAILALKFRNLSKKTRRNGLNRHATSSHPMAFGGACSDSAIPDHVSSDSSASAGADSRSGSSASAGAALDGIASGRATSDGTPLADPADTPLPDDPPF